MREQFTLLDLASSGRPKKVPDEVIKRCAEIVAKGFMHRLYTDLGQVYYEHTSMNLAIQHSQYLQQVVEEYNVDTAYLTRRCHEVDPHLVYAHVHQRAPVPDRIQIGSIGTVFGTA